MLISKESSHIMRRLPATSTTRRMVAQRYSYNLLHRLVITPLLQRPLTTPSPPCWSSLSSFPLGGAVQVRTYTTTIDASPSKKEKKKTSYTSLVPLRFLERMLLTVEIAVSKLFPGGFGWQAASVFAGSLGFAGTDARLWLLTGVGDFVGVFAGHMVYMFIKKTIFPSKKTMFDEFGVATWLSSAAFCSGTVWQPTVNFLVSSGLSFPSVSLVTTVVCGSAFLVGLRAGRRVYSSLGIERPQTRNFAEDAGLSVAIGGAAGLFVGTDITIPKNCFDTFVGVTPEMTTLQGCTAAGTSTAVGFAALHTIQNTRAQAFNSYVTRETFSDIINWVSYDLSRSFPHLESSEISQFVTSHVDSVFELLDKSGDGHILPEDVKNGLERILKETTAQTTTTTGPPTNA